VACASGGRPRLKAEYAAQLRNEGMHRAIASSVTVSYGTNADVVVFNGDPLKQMSLMERPPALAMLGGQKVDLARLA
jgi:uncharacterized 2Fe-2S/4Fe-4S cluster protein (DUF4445 family)